MNQMIATVANLFQTGVRNDDDLVDRLNHRYTVLLLGMFTILVSTTQYVGNPIHCWCPAYFTENHEKFANNVCWISNTYYLQDGVDADRAVQGPMIVQLPSVLRRHISYYQWVPVALLVQALLFYLPCLFWRILSDRSGINVNNLVEAAETIQNALYPERREKTIRYMIRHLDHYLDYQRDYRGGCCDGLKQCLHRFCPALVCGNRRGNYLVALYLVSKILYIANIVAQLCLLNLFLGADFHLYGIQVIVAIVRGRSWSFGNRFPRITLCDFEVFQVNGNLHRHTAQCVLPINFFNEKIYLFIWFWLLFVGLASCLSLFRWVWVLIIGRSRTRYIRKHLKIMDRLKPDCDRDRKLSYKFAERYLRQDGVFVLKLVAKNSTDLVVADIVAALWDHYRSKPMDLPHGIADCRDPPDINDPVLVDAL